MITRLLSFVPLIIVLVLINLIVLCETSPPSLAAPTILPAAPVTTDNLVCYPASVSEDTAYQWFKDGKPQLTLNTNVVDASLTQKGETWECKVEDDGKEASTEVTIQNAPPTSPVIDVVPALPEVTCDIIIPSSDPDGDPVSYEYEWFKDGTPENSVAADTVDASLVQEADSWQCIVTATDGVDVATPAVDGTIIIIADTQAVPLDDGSTAAIVPVNKEALASTKAMYVWDDYFDVIQYPSEQAHFLNVCKAAGINRVWMLTGNEKSNLDSLQFFLNDDTDPGNDVGGYQKHAYSTFIRAANSVGIKVDTLFGSATGRDVFEDGDASTLHAYVAAILKYNAEHPDAMFAGLHFDIESVGSGSYGNDEVFYVKYIDFIRNLKKWSFNGQTVVNQGLILSLYQDLWPGKDVSMNTWLALVREFNLVCLQSYGDTVSSVIAKEYGGVDPGRAGLLQREGLPFLIVVETGDASSNVTFKEEGRGYFESAMTSLNQYYSHYALFCGFGVHHYKNSIDTWY